MLLDEAGDGAASILAGRALRSSKSITLNKDVLKRHAAVLGGSGSGKTTLALCIIEQLLLKGTPAVLIDRKGDLCSYANPDVWRALEGELGERRGEREKLADSIDVAVYTPGRASGGRSPSRCLPERHQRAARPGAAAARQPVGGGARRHAAPQELGHPPEAVGHSVGGAAHPGRPLQQGGDARRSDPACSEDEDPELTDLTQRMDPVGTHPPRSRRAARQPAASQLGAVRGRRRAAAHGVAARHGPLSAATNAHAAVDHLHRASSATTRTSCSGSRSSCRRRCASASATPTTSCRPSSCSTRPTSTSRPTPSRPPPSRCRAC